MKNNKSKISPPQPIKEFAKDVLDFAKNEATKEELALIELELKEMIAMIENYQSKHSEKLS